MSKLNRENISFFDYIIFLLITFFKLVSAENENACAHKINVDFA